ncbi:BZ3500_MvSof-1268-A1-R1_Chr2-3g05350 [Microbotryum saponariae]|uniref:BZ3500_MvSof-1268-A1-R1_Chr2-3g05350 protein n=1 Tax=Microbotryum saponariae TaxID=289078 RepID=A0A2X0N2K0_9BASI|nr:BZ3500_MvSof-1268-A1-R1_Chr2-3g05350 [Microbotryum saponariae]SDA01252.1 BZ3501_MvSof-1269-A2-R1_Chr2-2g05023 [Microbotryum saponariae]
MPSCSSSVPTHHFSNMRISSLVCTLSAVATTTPALVSASFTKVHLQVNRTHRATHALSAGRGDSNPCGTTGGPDPNVEKLISVQVAKLNAKAELGASKTSRSGNLTFQTFCPAAQSQHITYVKVYWHQIVVDKTPEGGLLSQDRLNSQINTVNQFFDNNSFPFRLHLDPQDVAVVVDATTSQNYVVEGEADVNFKKPLRRGTGKDLNIYSVMNLGSWKETPRVNLNIFSVAIGWGTYPWYYANGNEDVKAIDGVTIVNAVIGPDQDATAQGRPTTEGKALAHEALHWIGGLLHTFQGNNCSGDGDYVADTRPQSASANGECPGPGTKFQLSCSATASEAPQSLQYAFDNYDNIMDYSGEACKAKITCGQMTRAIAMWNQYRAGT